MRRYLVIALAAVLLAASALAARTLESPAAGAASSCQFQKSTSTVAFCDTFDQSAAANSSRSGALNPTVWGVSDISALEAPSQGLNDSFVPATAPSACGGGSVTPPNNVQICNGQLFDTANDGGSQTIVAMYPRQPFDIAGRTGDVAFDVADDSLDGHAAWPSFVYTDQPVPAPYQSAAGINTYARNSFGITFAGQVSSNCPDGEFSVDSMYTTTNYALGSVPFSHDACVSMSSDPTVQNHIEIQLSATSAVVWASNPGSTSLTEIANANLTMPLTRGLVWMEDVHYNAGKYTPGQENNTFGWNDFGFDGPILPRDLGFDVSDHTQASSGGTNLGWASPGTVTTRADDPVTRADINAASGALLEFDFETDSTGVPSVSVNGNPPISTSWPFADSATYTWRTIAIPIPLSEIVTGTQSISWTGQQGAANFDIILAGAGGVPTCLDPSSCSSAGSSSGSSNPTPTPTSQPSQPSGVTTPTGLPEPVGQNDGVVDVFWRGASDSMMHSWYVPGAGWNGPVDMGGALASDPSPVATGGGGLDVFYEGTDGNLWHDWFIPGGGWYGPQDLGMGPLGGEPRAVSSRAGAVDLFWRGTDDGLWHAWYVNGEWNGGQELAPAGSVLSDPVPVSTGGGEIDVLWQDQTGGLSHISYLPSSNWSSPSSLASGTIGSLPSALAYGGGSRLIGWRGTDQNLWYMTASTGAFSGATSAGGRPLESSPQFASEQSGQVYAFWRGSDGSGWYDFGTPGQSWDGAAALPSGEVGSQPMPVSPAAGLLDVFWRGTDGGLWHVWGTDGDWAGPQELAPGGSFGG